jgi:hypothetical protein
MMQRPDRGQESHLSPGQHPLQGSPELSGEEKPAHPDQNLRNMILNKLNEWQIDTEIQSAMLANRKNAKHNRS